MAQAAGGRPVNRTADHAGDDLYPSWSPDGRQIAFWSNRDGGGYFALPSLGGRPERLVATPGRNQFYQSAPEWSPDGSELATVAYNLTVGELPAAAIVSLRTREVRRVPLPGTAEARLDLSWSRDGRFLAYVEAAQQQSEVTVLRVLRLADGSLAGVGRESARAAAHRSQGPGAVSRGGCRRRSTTAFSTSPGATTPATSG